MGHACGLKRSTTLRFNLLLNLLVNLVVNLVVKSL
jgi:hypothetical protein